MPICDDDLLNDLNEPQREAVAHTEGPLLILAGPGSGKTRVVTRRAVHLSRTVTSARNILAITFTNKAASEMRERIESLSGGGGMTVCTFHALCAKLLRWYHERAGVPRDFTIFDRDDRRKILKRAIEDADLPSANWTPAAVEQEISRAKNAMLTPDAYESEAFDWRGRTIARIYQQYESLLEQMAGLDFDDLLIRIARLLDTDTDLRAELEHRFRYVLVDEYQDTNAAQYSIVRRLTQEHGNLCATGDPDQSIYGWRGADIENILSFDRDYPSAKVVRLEQNYRSTSRILSAASALIDGNLNRKIKTLWTENEPGSSVRVIECETGDAEAVAVAEDIAQRIRDGADAGDIAVFYRVNSLSRTLEEAFIRSGTKYQIARGLAFYARKEIKDVLGYLRVLINPADEVALLRIINTPTRGIGQTTIDRLRHAAGVAGCSMHDAMMQEGIVAGLGRSGAKVGVFARLLADLKKTLELPPDEAIDSILSRSGLRAHYSAIVGGDDAPIRNLDELVSAASEFRQNESEATIRDWLEYTALLGDVDSVRDDAGAVTLMTLHAAKGLEFPIVYVVGLEDGLFPMRRNGEETDDMEEERRLLFVGMTRAKLRLTLCRAKYRMLRGVTQRTVRSPFLDELPRNELEWPQETVAARPPRRRPSKTGVLPDDIEQWAVGTLVRHPQCGLGRIAGLHRGARRTHVDVVFQDGRRCAWVLEFADLKRVDFDEVGDLDAVTGG